MSADNELESVIVNAAHRLEAGNIPENQLYIHFIQIGDEPGAADALKHLDNALSTKHHIPVSIRIFKHLNYLDLLGTRLRTLLVSLLTFFFQFPLTSWLP